MSWLTETLNKISKSYKGLNTSAMQGAGSMGLLNIERTAEKMNPEEAKEFKLKAKANLVTGTMLAPTVPLLVNGFATAPVTTALELVGGTASGIGATLATDKAIEKGSDGKYTGFTDYVTKKFPDSNPYIVEQFHPAAWIGGILGGAGTRNAFMRTPRGKVELVNSELAKNISNIKLSNSYLDDAVLSGKVGWGPNQIIHYRHGSYNPNLSKFEVHNTWDVTNRNASPFKWFGTEVSSPKNMMDDRPYQYIGLTEIKKPMTQLGEYNIKGKNDTRNYLVAESRQRGADAYYLQGIADNKAKDQNILIKFLDHNGEPCGFGIKPSKLTEAERLGIPKGGKVPYTTEENLAFRNQINEFAKKYGYNTIGDEVTDPEVLEKYARALIKLHNTFYRGISYAPDEATLMKWASQPRPNAEMYITPYSDVAKGYGDPVELLRPYKLGSDRTQWFTEGNFNIIPSAGDRISQGYSGKSGIYAPWVSRKPVLTSQGMVAPKPKFPESELVVINTNLIPKRVIYKMPVFSSYIKSNGEYRFSPWWKVGEMSPTGSKNLPNIHAEFKQGGSIHIKERNKCKFTESAQRAGKSVQEHARDVVNNPKATKLQKKRALFALNAKKFKH